MNGSQSIKAELLDADAFLSLAVASLTNPVPSIADALREIVAAREKILMLAEIAERLEGSLPKNN